MARGLPRLQFQHCTPFSTYNSVEQLKLNIEKWGIIMANVKMVTRTIEQTTAEVMCVDTNIKQVLVNTYKIGGVYTDEDLLKKLKNIFENSSLVLVKIENQKTEQLLLGMTEEDFIRYATVLPTRSTKKESEVE